MACASPWRWSRALDRALDRHRDRHKLRIWSFQRGSSPRPRNQVRQLLRTSSVPHHRPPWSKERSSCLRPRTGKIRPHHLEREACLYVRQSSLRQVAENTESARRQYGLRHDAIALGWPAECIRVIDGDQGKSGAYSGNRVGFRDLMARIGAGEVGIVLGLEVSRLARDNADWHQLLRIAGITDTLILDETGIYDPNDGNDRLLLGFKGTFSEFELRGIQARMIGGQRSARRAEP